MNIKEFASLSDEKKEKIIKHGTTNIFALKVIYLLVAVILFYLFASPYYAMWTSTIDAKTEVIKKEITGDCD